MPINVNYTDYPNAFDTVVVDDSAATTMTLTITAGTPDKLNFAVLESGGLVQTLSIEKEDARDIMLLIQKFIGQMDVA